MSKRTLIWNKLAGDGNKYNMQPSAYYLETDYEPIAVRIYAQDAPDIEDAEFNIYDDGATIFADRSSDTYYIRGGVQTQATPVTNAVLTKGENDEVFASDFTDTLIKGWITCNLIKDGGGRNFTVQLDLIRLSEEDENEE